MLNGKGFVNLSDSYAWASSGGVPDREKQLEDAVQAAIKFQWDFMAALHVPSM